MASVIGICNLALGRLGASLISDLSEPSREARLCRLFYEPVRDELLRRHPWNFARRRTGPPRLAEGGADDLAFAFNLPPDCLNVVRAEDRSGSPLRWRLEGRTLLAACEAPMLVYTKRETDPQRFDPLFTRTLAARLAAELAVPVTGLRTLASDLYALFERELAEAVLSDAREGTPPGSPVDPWLGGMA